MLEMRLVLCTLSFVVVSHTAPAFLSEERINAILEKLRRAHAVGELAVNTPNGLYPVKDINKDNFRRIFNFSTLPGKDLDADFTKKSEADGEDIDHKQFIIFKDQSSKKLLNTEKEGLRNSTDEITDDAAKLTAASILLANATNDKESHDVNILTTGLVGARNSTDEAESDSKKVETANPVTVVLPIGDNHQKEAGNDATEESSSKLLSSDDVMSTNGSSGKPLKQNVENEIEGSAELLEAAREGSGAIEESPTVSQEPQALLTGQDSDKNVIAASVDEPSLSISETVDVPVQATSANPTLPAINLPQFPNVPYVFLPVKSIGGAEVPGLSYLLIPKKYQNKLPNVFLTFNKV